MANTKRPTDALDRDHYDYLVVGAGLTSAVFSHVAAAAGKSVLVIEKRDHIAGNIYTKREDGIDIHEYGAHIFHTSDAAVWNFVNQFAEFNNYINCPVARYDHHIYNLPFNMNTFVEMWGIDAATPAGAQKIIDEQRAEVMEALDGREPANLEEQALSLVGRDIYEKLIKGYTEKQWGRDCKDLPPSIIKRLPVRMIYDNNYFNHRYQGIPMNGSYTEMVSNMFGNTEIVLGSEYKDFIKQHPEIADKTIYCGPIDEFFDYELGQLEYRSLSFETERIDGVANWQGNAVVNYTEREIPWTRIIEHKHFMVGEMPDVDLTYITREFPRDWKPGDEPYYPLNDERNTKLYEKYVELAKERDDVIFAGRLGRYKYYDMDVCIAAAFDLVKEELGVNMRFGS